LKHTKVVFITYETKRLDYITYEAQEDIICKRLIIDLIPQETCTEWAWCKMLYKYFTMKVYLPEIEIF